MLYGHTIVVNKRNFVNITLEIGYYNNMVTTSTANI